MTQFSIEDLDIIIESLKYSILKIENYPIGEGGYPSYEYKQDRLLPIKSTMEKVRELRKQI